MQPDPIEFAHEDAERETTLARAEAYSNELTTDVVTIRLARRVMKWRYDKQEQVFWLGQGRISYRSVSSFSPLTHYTDALLVFETVAKDHGIIAMRHLLSLVFQKEYEEPELLMQSFTFQDMEKLVFARPIQFCYAALMTVEDVYGEDMEEEC